MRGGPWAVCAIRSHLRSLGMQEYEALNKPLTDFMTQMGSESATVSDAARAWLQIQIHFDNLTAADLSRISCTPAADLQQLQLLCKKRVQDGMQDAHFLALLLDPRPSMRAFVAKECILGKSADHTLGNTDAMHAAQRCLKAMASALPVENRTTAEVGNALCKALQIYLQVRILH